MSLISLTTEGQAIVKNSISFRGAGLLLACAGLMGGCGLNGYGKVSQKWAVPYQNGELAKSEAALNDQGERALQRDAQRPSKHHVDALVFELENGAVLRAAGQLEASNAAFDRADKLLHRVDEKATVDIGKEVVAFATNLAEIDYEGYGYDHIMLHTYRSLNYMELGMWKEALVETDNVKQAQEMARANKQTEIAELEAKKAKDKKDKSGYDVDRAMKDPKLQKAIGGLKCDGIPDMSVDAIYTNPYAQYVQALYRIQLGDRADHETGRNLLRTLQGMCATNGYVTQDLAMAEQQASNVKTPPVTYVICEAGLAPARGSIRIDIPVFAYNMAVHDTGVDYVGASFPKLVFQDGGPERIRVVAGGKSYDTEVLANMDEIVGREFNDELPAAITRTLFSTGGKAVGAYIANKATEKGSEWVNIGTRIGTTLYQAATNQADERTWRTLPKTVQIARMETPADGVIALSSPEGLPLASVNVNPKTSNLVWVRAPGGGIYCRSAELNTARKPTTQPMAPIARGEVQ